MVLEHRKLLQENGFLARRRSRQALEWMNELVILGLEESVRANAAVDSRLRQLQEDVRRGQVTPFAASRELLRIFHDSPPPSTRT